VRHEKAALLLDLARRLASSAEGLTLDEMAAAAEVGRRTVERMRDALWSLFPQMDEVTDGPNKRFRISGGLDGLFQSPTKEELLELNTAASRLHAARADPRARTLESLERKVRSAMRSASLARIVPDLEALVRSEAIAVQAGPRPFEDETLVATLRQALMAMKGLAFTYLGGSKPGAVREVTPYGLMFGRSNYLVAALAGTTEPRNWRLGRMRDVTVLDRIAAPPEEFDLQAYANRSFGIYQEDIEEVVLRILPQSAEEALSWQFHPTQQVVSEPDGSVRVTFRASGMRELAWHLFTWRDQVEILAPARLKQVMLEELALSLGRHAARATTETVVEAD
jgi:predicted DNA-binding transcriptional regulator YafY